VRSLQRFHAARRQAEQHEIAEGFARTGMEKNAAFGSIPHTVAETGAPIFENCVCWFDCSVTAMYQAGTGVIFIGQIEAVSSGPECMPLLYRERSYVPHTDA
jgi:flavin reductase (DIM6/NTAB) family NADH-FMN oxidoreductase RutF